MTRDHERWAEALAIERQHGARAGRWVAERALTLALQRDLAGVERLYSVAMCLIALGSPTSINA